MRCRCPEERSSPDTLGGQSSAFNQDDDLDERVNEIYRDGAAVMLE